jgi:hypothetical protein
VALLSRAGPEPGVRAWLDALADHLRAAGWSGKVTAAPRAKVPPWLTGELRLPPQLTAFVSYRVSDAAMAARPRVGWGVSAEATTRIARAGSEWGRFAGAEIQLGRSIHRTSTTTPDVGPLVAAALLKYEQAGVQYLRSNPPQMASVHLTWPGQACFVVLDDEAPWQVRLDKAVQAILAVPDDTDLAFVQHSDVITLNWFALAGATPRPPAVDPLSVRTNKHLHAAYVPDAHGIQVLTDAHLRHAQDLSDWAIEPLGTGRHLVRAMDLAPWYATIGPDPDTLAKARADFGTMILTTETIAANPPPG